MNTELREKGKKRKKKKRYEREQSMVRAMEFQRYRARMNHGTKKRETVSQKNASLGRKEWPCDGRIFRIDWIDHEARTKRRATINLYRSCRDFFVNQQFSRVSGNLLPLLCPSHSDGFTVPLWFPRDARDSPDFVVHDLHDRFLNAAPNTPRRKSAAWKIHRRDLVWFLDERWRFWILQGEWEFENSNFRNEHETSLSKNLNGAWTQARVKSSL